MFRDLCASARQCQIVRRSAEHVAPKAQNTRQPVLLPDRRERVTAAGPCERLESLHSEPKQSEFGPATKASADTDARPRVASIRAPEGHDAARMTTGAADDDPALEDISCSHRTP